MSKHHLRLVSIIGGAILSIHIVTQLSAAELQIARSNSTLTVFDGDRPILRYRFGDVPMKPYVDRLYSPAGVQVLRDAPEDHKHHHGLMYALDVDGINFWEEHLANSGKEIGDAPSEAKPMTVNDVDRIGFAQQLDWTGPDSHSQKPLLVERRTINVFEAPDLGATLVQWCCSLQTPPDKDAMMLGGGHYFGLGIRFLSSMDVGGKFIYSSKEPGPILHEDNRLTPAKWCAYTASADGKMVTVALFDNPANLRHPATMFTMTQPFAYLSATLNQWRQPITVETDKSLDLCYGIAVWDNRPDDTTIEKLYQRWLTFAQP